MSRRTLRLTPALSAQLARTQRAAQLYPNPDDGSLPLEREKLVLADQVLAAAALARVVPRPLKAALPRPQRRARGA